MSGTSNDYVSIRRIRGEIGDRSKLIRLHCRIARQQHRERKATPAPLKQLEQLNRRQGRGVHKKQVCCA